MELLIDDISVLTAKKKLYIETYGCAMNVSDSEIVASVLIDNGFEQTSDEFAADVVLINTCAIRENAEQKIWHRLTALFCVAAAVVSFSRLYLDRHFLSDVLFGAVIGVVMGYAMLRWLQSRGWSWEKLG